MPDFNRAWCYWLDRTQPHPDDDKKGEKDTRYRVCFVFANETGFFPSGGTHHNPAQRQEPWWWTAETCKTENERKLGLSEKAVFEIVTHSIKLTNQESKPKRKNAKRAAP